MNYIKQSDSKGYYNPKTDVPNNSRYVLIYINTLSSETYKIGKYILNDWMIDDIFINNAQIISWMDIPEGV